MTFLQTDFFREQAKRDFTMRFISVRAQTVNEDARSVQANLSSENPVTVYDWNRGLIDEVLLADGADYPSQLPLLDAHQRSSVGNVLGSIQDIHRQGDTWVGTLNFAQNVPDAEAAWQLSRQGHITDVSIGYRSNQFQDIPAGQSATVNGKTYTASQARDLRVTTSHSVRECSLVPIGADPIAKLRAENVAAGDGISSSEITVHASRHDLPRIIAVAAGLVMRAGVQIKDKSMAESARRFAHYRLRDVCREAIAIETRRECDIRSDADLIDRAVGTGALAAIFTNSAQAVMMAAFEDEVDSTVGWVYERDVLNFQQIFSIGIGGDLKLKELQRGQAAEQVSAADFNESYAVMRLARQWAIDDQDIADDRVDVLIDTPSRLGRAAKRAKADLVYSLILSNPTLNQDNQNVFCTNHGNYGTSSTALSAATLQAGVASVDNQIDPRSDANAALQTPYGLRAGHLIVPPDLKLLALELARNVTVPTPEGGEERLIVHSDARLGVGGVIWPKTNKKYVGTRTNWLLAANAGRTIEVAYLSKYNRKPQLRGYNLSGGEFGIGFDIAFDLGASFADYPGLYFATGASE